MIYGYIDAFQVVEHGVKVSGWAYHENDRHHRLPVDVCLEVLGSPKYFSERYVRTDISSEQEFGISFTLPSIAELCGLVTEEVRCKAQYLDEISTLPVWSRMKVRLLSKILRGVSASLDEESIAELLGTTLNNSTKKRASDSLEFANLLVSIGFKSFDSSVVVGRCGHLFLEGGSNSLAGMYANHEVSTLVNGWVELILRRQDQVAATKARFVQIIIPEKQSILGSFHPRNIEGCTPLLSSLREELNGRPFFFDVLGLFRRLLEDEGIEPFRKVDSHLTFHGYAGLVDSLTAFLEGGSIIGNAPALRAELRSGDLGSKLGFGYLLEDCLFPAEATWAFALRKVDLIESIDPQNGHLGIVRHWRCEEALVSKTVLIFGNSMFERGTVPLTLSWWFARIYRSTYFVWSPDIDFELVHKMKPDLVIGQTVERFLGHLPSN